MVIWAEPQPIPPPPRLVPQRRAGILSAPLGLVGGIAGIALGGIGGAGLGALLGMIGGMVSRLVLIFTMALAALMAVAFLLAGRIRHRESERARGEIGLALVGLGFVFYALVRTGERLRPWLILPLDSLAADPVRRADPMGILFTSEVLRATAAGMGVWGLVVGSVIGARWGFRLGRRRPVLTLLALAAILSFAIGTVLVLWPFLTR